MDGGGGREEMVLNRMGLDGFTSKDWCWIQWG